MTNLLKQAKIQLSEQLHSDLYYASNGMEGSFPDAEIAELDDILFTFAIPTHLQAQFTARLKYVNSATLTGDEDVALATILLAQLCAIQSETAVA